MTNRLLIIAGVAMLSVASCTSQYKMTDVARTRILIDSRFDGKESKQTMDFMVPYTAKVDSVISPVVGETAKYLSSRQPESSLSNLLPDILMWGSAEFGEHPDFCVYNVGGIRAAFPEGKVTVGDVMDVAPFANRLIFCTLTGEKVLQLFQQMASYGGQGVSHGVEAKMDEQGKLISLKINGADVDPLKEYRIGTLDYVAEGNDNLVAFKSKTALNYPTDGRNEVKRIIINYFKDRAARGEKVDSQVEGRFVRVK